MTGECLGYHVIPEILLSATPFFIKTVLSIVFHHTPHFLFAQALQFYRVIKLTHLNFALYFAISLSDEKVIT